MFRAIDASTDRFLDSLRVMNERMERAQREVASGKRVTAPSDAPDSISTLLQVRADLSRLDQVGSNLNRVRAEVDAGESALSSAIQLFDRVRTLGMTGASTVQSPLTRESIASELQGILDRLVALANTQVDGRYIFSGDSDTTPAFSLTPALSAYQGSAATRQALHPAGVPFPVAMSADQIFTHPNPDRNVLASIENLRQALLSGDEDAMKQALVPLGEVSAHLNSALSFYGNGQTRVAEAVDTAARLKLRLRTELSELEDADPTQAIIDMQQASFQRDAALQVRGSFPSKSLFDYLG